MSTPHLVLASQSPARLATLRAAGLDPEVIASGVDESAIEISDPERLSVALARLKAEAVAAQVHDEALVIGCDSVLELDGEVHGKPGSPEIAARRWRAMRGRAGVLHTGHCVIRTEREHGGDRSAGDRHTGSAPQSVARAARTVVHFADVTDAEIAAYVATGEPLQVAGGFTIDGLGGAFVRAIDGDPHTVVGVGLPLLRTMVRELGFSWPELWAPCRMRAGPA